MPENLQAVVLAGGKSVRFNTGRTKLTEKICGKEMILYPLELLQRMQIPTAIVVGFLKETIIDLLTRKGMEQIEIVQQKEQLGSGHAVKMSMPVLQKDHILVINGDIPLMTSEVIFKLYQKHILSDADISFITAHATEQTLDSYCRVVIHDNKIKVIEVDDTTIDPEAQCCISVGVYIIKRSFLEQNIDQLSCSKLTGEYYLPELISIASNKNCKIVTIPVSFDIARGVNTLAELWVVEHIKRSQLINYWMQHGVRFAISLNVLIDADVIIEQGVYIGSGVHLLGKTLIKKNATIGAFAYIEDTIISENVQIQPHTVIMQSTIEKDVIIPSFTNIVHQKIDEFHPKPKQQVNRIFTGAIKDDMNKQEDHNL